MYFIYCLYRRQRQRRVHLLERREPKRASSQRWVTLKVSFKIKVLNKLYDKVKRNVNTLINLQSDRYQFSSTKPNICILMVKTSPPPIFRMEKDFLMIKEYSRPAAGKDATDKRDLRPPSILLEVVEYMMTEWVLIYSHALINNINIVANVEKQLNCYLITSSYSTKIKLKVCYISRTIW